MGDGTMQVFSWESFKQEEVWPYQPRMENFAEEVEADNVFYLL